MLVVFEVLNRLHSLIVTWYIEFVCLANLLLKYSNKPLGPVRKGFNLNLGLKVNPGFNFWCRGEGYKS